MKRFVNWLMCLVFDHVEMIDTYSHVVFCGRCDRILDEAPEYWQR